MSTPLQAASPVQITAAANTPVNRLPTGASLSLPDSRLPVRLGTQSMGEQIRCSGALVAVPSGS